MLSCYLKKERGLLENGLVCGQGLPVNGMGRLPEWARSREREIIWIDTVRLWAAYLAMTVGGGNLKNPP